MSATGRTLRLVTAAAAAAAVLVGPSILTSPAPQSTAQPRVCVNGVVPGNPYIENCSLPPRGPRIRGQAPDATAIIACRGWPGCLSWYVNGPY